MKISALLKSNDAFDWLKKHQDDFVIVPRELTIEAREVFHSSMDKYESGESILGCPDDQWNSMIEVMGNDE
jgi:hypothetical protein